MTMGSGEYPPALLSISGSPVSSENIMAHSGCSTSAEVQTNQRNLCFRTDFQVFFLVRVPAKPVTGFRLQGMLVTAVILYNDNIIHYSDSKRR